MRCHAFPPWCRIRRRFHPPPVDLLFNYMLHVPCDRGPAGLLYNNTHADAPVAQGGPAAEPEQVYATCYHDVRRLLGRNLTFDESCNLLPGSDRPFSDEQLKAARGDPTLYAKQAATKHEHTCFYKYEPDMVRYNMPADKTMFPLNESMMYSYVRDWRQHFNESFCTDGQTTPTAYCGIGPDGVKDDTTVAADGLFTWGNFANAGGGKPSALPGLKCSVLRGEPWRRMRAPLRFQGCHEACDIYEAAMATVDVCDPVATKPTCINEDVYAAPQAERKPGADGPGVCSTPVNRYQKPPDGHTWRGQQSYRLGEYHHKVADYSSLFYGGFSPTEDGGEPWEEVDDNYNYDYSEASETTIDPAMRDHYCTDGTESDDGGCRPRHNGAGALKRGSKPAIFGALPAEWSALTELRIL